MKGILVHLWSHFGQLEDLMQLWGWVTGAQLRLAILIRNPFQRCLKLLLQLVDSIVSPVALRHAPDNALSVASWIGLCETRTNFDRLNGYPRERVPRNEAQLSGSSAGAARCSG
jgi:hypothetical protein